MLERLIKERRAAILEGWMERILSSYPQESRRFLERKGDPFGNPMGSTFRRCTETIVDHLCGDADDGRLTAALAELVRLRAVQDLPPSQSISFILALKDVVRAAPGEAAEPGDLVALDDRVAGLLMQAFDLYVGCRNKMFEIRMKEEKRRSAVLLRRMERVGDPGAGDE